MWPGRILGAVLREAAGATPDKLALVDARRRQTYRELAELVDAAALGLVDAGVRPGVVVTVQLPNWAEFVVAAFDIDAAPARPVAAVVASTFRGFAYSPTFADLAATCPSLRTVIVVDGGPARATGHGTSWSTGAGRRPSTAPCSTCSPPPRRRARDHLHLGHRRAQGPDAHPQHAVGWLPSADRRPRSRPPTTSSTWRRPSPTRPGCWSALGCSSRPARPACSRMCGTRSGSLPELRDHLGGVTQQVWPERVEVLDELPLTPSGKVQKYKLRKLAAGS